ncbi:phage tail fiber protein [Paenibacillus dendritiformis]|uniref:phage tail fiber protein n=1 Tax=Paenibacillus dendritiformis TaxID=130049 RepID=UPI00387E04A6
MNISNAWASTLLKASLRGVSFTPPGTVYLALYTSDPTPADTGTEVSGGGYKRMAIPFVDPTTENGMQTVKNAADVEFPIATADWGLVTHIGLRTAATGGTLMWSAPVPNPRTIQNGDKPKFLKDGTLVRFTN